MGVYCLEDIGTTMFYGLLQQMSAVKAAHGGQVRATRRPARFLPSQLPRLCVL